MSWQGVAFEMGTEIPSARMNPSMSEVELSPRTIIRRGGDMDGEVNSTSAAYKDTENNTLTK